MTREKVKHWIKKDSQKMEADLDPVWTYRDRGYYSMAFIGPDNV